MANLYTAIRFTTITRRYVERITVMDAETIRIKFRYTDVEIDRTIRK